MKSKDLKEKIIEIEIYQKKPLKFYIFLCPKCKTEFGSQSKKPNYCANCGANYKKLKN